jgi:hypothetical protein
MLQNMFQFLGHKGQLGSLGKMVEMAWMGRIV